MRAEAPEFIPNWNQLSVANQEETHSPDEQRSNKVEKNNHGRRRKSNNKQRNMKKKGEVLKGNDLIKSNSLTKKSRGKTKPEKNEVSGCNGTRHNFARKKTISSKKQRDAIMKETTSDQQMHSKNSRRRRRTNASLPTSCIRDENILLPKQDKTKSVVIDATSFPSLSQSNDLKQKEQHETANAENGWSQIVNEGHTKSVMRHINHIRESERVQREIDTYTRMDVLGSETIQSLVQDEHLDSNANHTEVLVGPTSIEKDKLSSVTGKFLNVAKLREKWCMALEQWRMNNKKDEEIRERNKQLKSTRIFESDSTCNSFYQSSEEEEDDEDISSRDAHGAVVSHPASSVPGNCVLYSRYLEMKYPLHIALSNNDKDAIKALIVLSPERTLRDEKVSLSELQSFVDFSFQKTEVPLDTKLSLLHLAVVLGNSSLLQFLLSCASSSNLNFVTSTFAVDDPDDQKRTPIMLACELRFNDGIKVLLAFGSKMSLRHQRTGDIALHIACRVGEPSTVSAVLGSLRGKDDSLNPTKDKNSARQRLVSSRNRKNETSLHIACRRGRFDIVEALLADSSSAAANKALATEDDQGHTPLLSAIMAGDKDIVMHLLTWRGNHRGHVPFARDCPLVLAVGTKSMEMFQLLLECRSLSIFESYDYSGALLKVIWCFQEREPEAYAFIQLLIEEGADPHEKVSVSESLIHDEDGDCILGKTPLTLAAMQGSVHFVTEMLDAHSRVRRTQITAMRCDPCLRAQSSDYFLSIEKRERKKVRDSCEETFLKVLIASCEDRELSSRRLGCCLGLIRRDTSIDDFTFVRLLKGIRNDETKQLPCATQALAPTMVEFEGQYGCTTGTSTVANSPYYRPVVKDWSESLMALGWMRNSLSRDSSSCPWFKKALIATHGYTSKDEMSEMCIFLVEGKRLEAHKSILIQKCVKLEAAIRFEEMKQRIESDNDSSVLEIALDLSLCQFCFLIQHCYHGSICSGLPSDLTACCQEILDLYLLSLEYLCPSLALECEMRLLSSNPYKCFCCNCCDRAEPNSKLACPYELSCHYKVKVCEMIISTILSTSHCLTFFSGTVKVVVTKQLPWHHLLH